MQSRVDTDEIAFIPAVSLSYLSPDEQTELNRLLDESAYNYREILRFKSLGFNHSQIVESTAISRPTVITVMQRAMAQGLDWQTAESLSDRELYDRLYPQDGGKPSYKMPDYDYVHREMSKPGVTQQLLWFEYCDQCRATGEIPYQLTQFKTHYREYLTKNKATMHISHKPGEQMEVDWAGQTAGIVDTDTGEIIDANILVAALPFSGYSYVHESYNIVIGGDDSMRKHKGLKDEVK